MAFHTITYVKSVALHFTILWNWRNRMANDITPFTFLNAINKSKEDIIRNHEDFSREYMEKLYNAFMVNRGLSYFEDTILHANEMNQKYNLSADAQFQYFRNVLTKRNRFSKWNKRVKDEELDLIQEIYECSREKAKGYRKILSDSDIKKLKETRYTGGIKGNK